MNDPEILMQAGEILVRRRQLIDDALAGITAVLGTAVSVSTDRQPLALPAAPPSPRGRKGTVKVDEDGEALCANPECCEPFVPRTRKQTICKRKECKLWKQREYQRKWALLKRRATGAIPRRGRPPKKQLQSKPPTNTGANGLSAVARSMQSMSPRNALIAYARAHGGHLVVSDALPDLKASGVFAGVAKAIFNKATALLDEMPEFHSNLTEGRTIYELE